MVSYNPKKSQTIAICMGLGGDHASEDSIHNHILYLVIQWRLTLPLQSLTAFCCFFEEFYWGIRRPFFLTLKNSWGIPGGVLDPRIHAYFSKACTPERTMSLTSKVKCIRMRGDRGDRCLKIQPSKLAPGHKLSDFPTALLSHGLVTAHQAVGPRNIG